ncbi:MAG: hypothetical protein GX162_13555 [Firmicutes bacterium]|nr:hypothetical protein [Bacillota bacterium]
MKRYLFVTVVMVIALNLVFGEALAAEGLRLFVDFEQLPEDMAEDFTAQFNEDLAALHDVAITNYPVLADVFILAAGSPIMAADTVIGYSLALTMLCARGADNEGVITYVYPSVIPVVVGPSHIEWAARQAVLELNAYLDWLVEVGEFKLVDVSS